MSAFIDAMQKETTKTFTENGALAHKTTLNPVLDFFANAGGMRKRTQDAIPLFMHAFYTDKTLALKALFHLRDILKGNGERELFRVICMWLAKEHPEEMKRNMKYIPDFGRWDDLYAFVNTPLEEDAFKLMHEQFLKDMSNNNNISLLGKWLKSENATSRHTTQLARITMNHFNMKAKDYRKALTSLREKIHIVENDICKKIYEQINYEHIPSQAMNKYKCLFMKHDRDRFIQYLASVAKNEAKINAKTLTPAEIIGKYLDRACDLVNKPDEVNAVQALWNALPNYADNSSTIVVADVSGSMCYGKNGSRPIDVCVSLAMYFAERSTGPFKDTFITFSTEPALVKLCGDNIIERIKTISQASWMMSTDIYRVFKLILTTAQNHKLTDDDMPKRVIIISDMEFDRATPEVSQEIFDMIDNDYKAAGYKRPLLVFWNVDARHVVYPVTKLDRGTVLVSGNSIATFNYIMNADENTTPIDLMLQVLNSERYNCIQ